VVRYFQEKIDLDPEDMEAVGRSFYQPEASNDTKEGRARNRRVEILIAPQMEVKGK
jgi:chemotaxis protein MotB